MTVDNNKAMAWPQSRVARTEDKSILTLGEQQKQEFYFGFLNEFLLIGSNQLVIWTCHYTVLGGSHWMLHKLLMKSTLIKITYLITFSHKLNH